jgi:MOSC domain-containing protein YiiM
MSIERIFTRAPAGGPQLEHQRISVTAGAGIDGDRYFGKHDEPGQNITLVEAEEIETFLQHNGRPHDLAITGRNLVTRGVRLNDLLGREFVVGGVRLRGVELCEPCLGMGEALQSATLTPAAVVRQWVHRAGLRADVLAGGEIAVGAPITAAPAAVPDEHGRLQELKRLMVMDTLEEMAYDDITRLAAAMSGAPIALISFVDETRQWFKSRIGLQATETPRELAFCAIAIQTPDQALVVPDALQDPRFASNPLVTSDPNIRFYAGAPLVTSAGHALGTVCVIDTKPREWTAEQVEQLKFLAQQVVAMLEARADPAAADPP